MLSLVPNSFQAWEDGGIRMMEHSVARSSRRTYCSGWKAWVAFTKSCEVDPYLRYPPSTWIATDHLLAFEPSVAVAFCAYSLIQGLLSPATINSYLAGVSFVLRLSNINVDFLSSPAVVMAKTGMRHVYEAARDKKDLTLPFTLDMILRYAAGVDSSNVGSHGMVTALLLAHFNFFRISEYAVTDENHFLRSGDVAFVTADGCIHNATSVAKIELADVVRVTFFIRSSKTDQDKIGCTNHFKKREVGTCVCTEAFLWARRANFPTSEVPFLSAHDSSGRRLWRINSKSVSNTIKTVARTFGFQNLKSFTPHSLRYGAASALAAAGVDEYTIRLLGRWRSNAFMQYIKLSSLMLDSAYLALSDPAAMSAADVALL